MDSLDSNWRVCLKGRRARFFLLSVSTLFCALSFIWFMFFFLSSLVVLFCDVANMDSYIIEYQNSWNR